MIAMSRIILFWFKNTMPLASTNISQMILPILPTLPCEGAVVECHVNLHGHFLPLIFPGNLYSLHSRASDISNIFVILLGPIFEALYYLNLYLHSTTFCFVSIGLSAGEVVRQLRSVCAACRWRVRFTWWGE
jgi:hypothetical protein